jgi:hypothetical protein
VLSRDQGVGKLNLQVIHTDLERHEIESQDLKRELAFEEWVRHIPTRMLECRVNRHDFPDWSDKRACWRKNRFTRIISVEVPCKRKCGTTFTQFLDADGFKARSNIIRHFYDPEYHYLMPPEARGPGLTKARRAKLRLELMTRNEDRIEYDD